jgi:hypothetical protein
LLEVKAVRIKGINWTSVGLSMAGILILISQSAVAEMSGWESALAKMRNGAVQMIEGGKMLQDKKDFGSAEKTIKDGHRMMMEAEKATAQIQKNIMKRGAKLMMEGLQILKSKNDVEEAERLMVQGQKMILEAERMMDDPRIEKMMLGSRTMMRGLRMMQAQDMNTAHRLMKDGQTLMMEAERLTTD